jgi:hypothetical protein
MNGIAGARGPAISRLSRMSSCTYKLGTGLTQASEDAS